VRFIVDFVDSPTLALSRAADLRRDQQALFHYTKWKWRQLERRVQDVVDATIYVSKVDARTARRKPTSRVHVIPNGITFTDAPAPLVRGQHGNRTVGFLGNMSYKPNVSAVLRLARRIFPGVLAAIADARLLIIGRDPTDEIKDLRSGIITVTGTVEDIWAYISRVSVLVLPMVEGAGLQNKVLEAMYAGVPVVTTTVVALGVGATDGEHLLVGNSDQELIDKTLRILRDGAYADRLAGLAREFVLHKFVWQTILPQYETIVSPGGSARSSYVRRDDSPQVANRGPNSQL